MAEMKTSVAAPEMGEPGEVCCGGRHAPHNGGKPLGLSCQLCDSASIYWRNEPGFKARLAANPDAYPLPETPA